MIIILPYLYHFISKVALATLNFPSVDFRFKKNEKGTIQLFDIIRKKFVDMTPEEWVRQHIIHFLILNKEVPASMISVEKQLILNQTKKRTDLVIFNPSLKPLLIIECKAPHIAIDQNTINQALRYNIKLKVPFIFLSNGHTHICIQWLNNEAIILKELPAYSKLVFF